MCALVSHQNFYCHSELNDEHNHPTYPSFERETFHFRQNIPEVAPENQPAQISGEMFGNYTILCGH